MTGATDPKIDSARAIRSGEELDQRALSDFLRARLKLETDLSLRQFPAGFSNLTYLVTAGEREWVLRCPPNGKKAATAHDVAREYGILKGLDGKFNAAPKAVLLCEDPAVIGKPFYLMERLRGVILRRRDPKFSGITPEGYRAVCEQFVDIQADLHRLDYHALPIAATSKPQGYVERQMEGWLKRHRDAHTLPAPRFRAVTAWLQKHVPGDTKHPALIHNDYKLDNLVLDPQNGFHIQGVLDWEMATIGDPLMDLGCSLAYWVERRDPFYLRVLRTLPTTADGALTREQIVARYARATGFDVRGIDWYYVFGLFRLAGIAQQIYYRYYHRQTRDPRFRKLILGLYALEAAAKRTIRRSAL